MTCNDKCSCANDKSKECSCGNCEDKHNEENNNSCCNEERNSYDKLSEVHPW